MTTITFPSIKVIPTTVELDVDSTTLLTSTITSFDIIPTTVVVNQPRTVTRTISPVTRTTATLSIYTGALSPLHLIPNLQSSNLDGSRDDLFCGCLDYSHSADNYFDDCGEALSNIHYSACGVISMHVRCRARTNWLQPLRRLLGSPLVVLAVCGWE